MSQLTTHVLDTALGRPAVGVPVALDSWVADAWVPVGSGVTDADGRARSLAPDAVAPGRYRFTFDTAAYFAATGQAAFHPEVAVVFDVVDDSHYHVPLLLSPFAYSTYRGS
ncbi:hydroxyisourate hydrolase [Cellulomonas sp. ICMP 17802]|uniref:hydroxyisourate hydrolase n=1 Tax=Cellulomonas sp. ICMP 17802 TaxID=3239199 RepID=UPI00351BBF2D